MKNGKDGRLAKDDPLGKESYRFAIQIVKLARSLQVDQKEYVLSRQVLKSGTAIGALIQEAKFAQSRADFTSKMSIALKEASETAYWLSLLKDTETISFDRFAVLHRDCDDLISMLVATVKTSKRGKQ